VLAVGDTAKATAGQQQQQEQLSDEEGEHVAGESENVGAGETFTEPLVVACPKSAASRTACHNTSWCLQTLYFSTALVISRPHQ
jgi:hypothetical protein